MTATQPGTRHQSGRFARIVRRVASVVEEMNYAQRRSVELFLGRAKRRRPRAACLSIRQDTS